MQTIIEADEKPLGVIEALQKGFNFLNQHLWLILLPIVLDLFLWLGPRLSIASLVNQLVQTLPPPADMPAELAANFDMASESLQNLGSGYNLLSLLTGLLTGLPSLFARLDFQAAIPGSGQVIELTSWQSALLATAALIPLGILIGSFWLAHMVAAVKGERMFTQTFFRRWGWIWLNLNLYLIVLFFGIIFFSIFFGMIGALFLTLFGSAGAAMFGILWLLAIGFSIWLSIGLYFVVYAIAVDGVNLASAMWRSLNVVGRNAFSTLGFLLLTLLILEGFSRIWLAISQQQWGVLLSICGNAYLGTAIVAAAIFFYQSRYQRWQTTRSLVILSQQSENSSEK